MATYMDRDNFTHSHMGGEGLTWVGQSAFVETDHVFQNMGDGTFVTDFRGKVIDVDDRCDLFPPVFLFRE